MINVGITFIGWRDKLLEKILQNMQLLGIDTKGWEFFTACKYIDFMAINAEEKSIAYCLKRLRELPDYILLQLVAHEVSHIKTDDEALATIYAVRLLKDRLTEDLLRQYLEVWYGLYTHGYLTTKLSLAKKRLWGEEIPPFEAKQEYVERIKKYLDNKITLEELLNEKYLNP